MRLFLAGLLTYVAVTVALNVRLRRQARALAAARGPADFATFAAALASPHATPDLLRAVHDALRAEMASVGQPAFAVRADDDLEAVYGWEGEDIEDALATILPRCGRRMPTPQEATLPVMLSTVQELVAFAARCPPDAGQAGQDAPAA